MAGEAKIAAGAVVQVKWGSGDHLEPIFVDNMHLARANEQFYLTFGQIRVPVATGEKAQSGAEIRPMVRVVITKDALERVVALIAKTIKQEE